MRWVVLAACCVTNQPTLGLNYHHSGYEAHFLLVGAGKIRYPGHLMKARSSEGRRLLSAWGVLCKMGSGCSYLRRGPCHGSLIHHSSVARRCSRVPLLPTGHVHVAYLTNVNPLTLKTSLWDDFRAVSSLVESVVWCLTYSPARASPRPPERWHMTMECMGVVSMT